MGGNNESVIRMEDGIQEISESGKVVVSAHCGSFSSCQGLS